MRPSGSPQRRDACRANRLSEPMTNDAPAYVASPPTGKGPPVLLLHTWWGLNQPIKDLADRLAGDGFTSWPPTFSTEPS